MAKTETPNVERGVELKLDAYSGSSDGEGFRSDAVTLRLRRVAVWVGSAGTVAVDLQVDGQ